MKSLLRAVCAVVASFCLSSSLINECQAVPASPDPFTVRQPNGLEIKLRMRGDEWFSWHETVDGNPVVSDPKTGFWVYAAQAGNGDLVSTGRRVGVDKPNTKAFKVRPTEHEKKKIKEQQAVASRNTASSSGTGLVPVILANFNDTTPTISRSTISNMLFSTAPGAKSMSTYYSEVSYGQFTVAAGPSGVQNWVTVPNSRNFYGGNIGNWKDTNAPLFIRQAVQAAVSAGYDFSPYDQDGDGKVDVVNIVHTGPGEEAGGGTNTIWSHRFSLSAAGLTPITVGAGLVVDDYVIQPELNGDGSSGSPITVGVFVHEHGHALGLPDLYDTDYSSCGVGNWSGMSFGANLSGGTSPAHFDPWCKSKLGWLTPINYTLDYQNVQFPCSETTPFVARLWKDGVVGSQYYLVENRYRTNFDAAIPADGLLIWHIDESKTGNTKEWYPISAGGSPANTNSGNFLVRMVQADGLFQMDITNQTATLPSSAQQNQGDSGDPFPGSSNNRNFGTNTFPNSRSYNNGTTPGFNTYVAVNNISDAGPVMTADIFTRSPNSGPYVEWRNIAGIVPPYEYATFTKLGEFNPVVIKALPGVVGTPLKQMQLYINRAADGLWWDFPNHNWTTNPISSNVDISGVAQNGLTLAYQNNLPNGTNLVNGTYTFLVRVINTSDIVTELQMPMVAEHKPEVRLTLKDNGIVNTLSNFSAIATEESGVGIQRVEVALYYDTEAHDVGTASRWYWDGYNWTTSPMWLGANFTGNPTQATLLYPIGPDAPYLVSGRQYYITARAIDGVGVEATNQISVMYDTGTPPNYYWRYGGSGNWFDSANWDPIGVPGAGDHVAISVPGDYTVTVNGNANVASLRMGRGIGLSKQQLIIPSFGALTLTGADTNKFFSSSSLLQGGNLFAGPVRFFPESRWTWTNATLGANVLLDVSSALTVKGDADKGFANGSFLLNRGAILWQDNGRIVGGGGATITNVGLFSMEGNGSLNYNNSGAQTLLANGAFGVIRKTTQTTNSIHQDYNGWNFANYGTIDIQAGAFVLRNYNKSFAGGTLTGTGAVRTEGGILTVVGTTALNNGTLQLAGEMVGAGGFTGSGTVDWQAGMVFSSARITNGASVLLRLSPGPQKSLTGASILQQYGPTIVTESGAFIISQGAEFYNAGNFEIRTNATFYYNNSGNYSTFINQPGGTIVKLTTNVANFHHDYTGIRFVNNGLVDVQSGTLQFGGGGGTSYGEFRVSNGAAIEFTANTQTIGDGASITGAGVVRLLGGRVDANSGNGAVVLQGTLEISTNGTLGGTASWTGTGTMRWNAGFVTGSQIIGSGLTFNILGSSERFLQGATLVNNGTINWLDDGNLITSLGATITNKNLFHAQGSARLMYNNAGNYPAFYNEPGSVFRKSGNGTVTFWHDYTGVSFFNRGTIDVQGGILELRSGTKALYGGGTISGPGRVQNAAGSLTLSGTTTLSGSTFQNMADIGGQGGFAGNGVFEWSAGSIGGGAQLTNGANVQLLISPGGPKSFWGNSLIQQNGPTLVTEAGYVTFSQGSVFNNAGLFQMPTNTTFYYNNSGNNPTFNNLASGTMLKTSTNTLFFHWDYTGIRLNNQGLIDVQSGALLFGGGGGPSSGEFKTAAGSSIEFVGQTQTFSAGSKITGAGVTRVLGGRVDAETGSGALTISGTLEISTNGIFGGTAKLDGAGTVDWSGGRIQSVMTISPGLTMNIKGSAQHWFEFGRIVNDGTINWLDDGEWSMNLGAIITNRALFHAQGRGTAAYYNGGGYAEFHNEAGATFRKTGSGTNTFSNTYGGVNFFNRGTLDIQQGMLSLENNSKTFSNGSSINGAGRVKTTYGLLNIGGTTTFNGGTLELASDMTGPVIFAGNGTFDWSAGAIYGSQITNQQNVLWKLSPGATKLLTGGTVVQQLGNTVVTDPGALIMCQSAVFDNAGVFDIRTNTTFYYNNSGNYPAFNNLAGGTVRRSGGGGTAIFHGDYGGIPFNNFGSIDLRTGALAFHSPNTSAASAAWTIAIGGTNLNNYPQATYGVNANLNGSLAITLTNGFTPTDGDSFNIVTYPSRSGQFTTPSLPQLPFPLKWNVSYGANALNLRVEKAHTLTSVSAPVNGQFTLNFTGPSATSAVLQSSTNLVDWLSLETNAPFTGTFQFNDPNATARNKFYRVLITP